MSERVTLRTRRGAGPISGRGRRRSLCAGSGPRSRTAAARVAATRPSLPGTADAREDRYFGEIPKYGTAQPAIFWKAGAATEPP
jgi:hypothetical protein